MLGISHTQCGDQFTVALNGELALDTVEAFHDVMDRRAPQTEQVVFDCAGLFFADSTGVNALLQAALRLKRRGVAAEVVNLNDDLREMLDVTGFFEVLGSA